MEARLDSRTALIGLGTTPTEDPEPRSQHVGPDDQDDNRAGQNDERIGNFRGHEASLAAEPSL